MNLLNRLTVKNLQLNKRRTTVTIIGIMLSAALITAVASMYVSGIKAMISLEKRLDGNFHAVFYHVPVSDLDRFENNRNIESYNLVKEIGYARIDSKNKDKPYACLKGFTEGSYDDLSVRIVSGRFPENDREIVIPTHLKTNGGLDYKVSDMITLELGRRVYNGGFELGQDDPYEGCGPEGHGESLTVTETRTYTIVGVIERPASTIENYAAPGYTFITYADHDEMTGKVDVYARFTKDAVKKSYETMANILGVDPALFQKVYDHEGYSDDELAELSKQMEDSYLIDINRSLIDMETGFISTSSVGGLGIVAGIVIGVIVAASVFCIKNSFDISITEKIKQYGMLRSIGATKKQIRNNVFYEAGILGLIGIPLGILLGYLASYLLVIFSNYYLYFFTGLRDAGFKLEYSFSAIAALIAATLGIVTVYFSAFRSARKASKVSPIDSIRNSADIRINPKKIRSPKIINRIFGIGGEISYKSLKRNRRQYRTTMISIIVSVFVFITLSGFMGSAIREVESELKISDYNISLIANTVNQDSYHRFLETVHFDGVEDYSIVRDSQLSFTGNHYSKEYADFYDLNPGPDTRENIFIICVGKDQYQKYIRSLGLNPADIKDKAILLDKEMQADYDKNNDIVQKYMRKFDFNKGDIIAATITSSGKNVSVEIGEITDMRPFGMKDSRSACMIVSDEMFDAIAETQSLEIYYRSQNAGQTQNDIAEYLIGEDYFMNNKDENVREMSNFLTLISVFMYGFIIVMTLIGITSVFNTVTSNMELRKPEFAMLKSVGMTSKEFDRMIGLESLFISAKSLFIGVPIGVILSYMIHHVLSDEFKVSYRLPAAAIVISIAAVLLLASFLMRYSVNKISKQNTIETIRNENI